MSDLIDPRPNPPLEPPATMQPQTHPHLASFFAWPGHSVVQPKKDLIVFRRDISEEQIRHLAKPRSKPRKRNKGNPWQPCPQVQLR